MRERKASAAHHLQYVPLEIKLLFSCLSSKRWRGCWTRSATLWWLPAGGWAQSCSFQEVISPLGARFGKEKLTNPREQGSDGMSPWNDSMFIRLHFASSLVLALLLVLEKQAPLLGTGCEGAHMVRICRSLEGGLQLQGPEVRLKVNPSPVKPQKENTAQTTPWLQSGETLKQRTQDFSPSETVR